MHVFNMMLRNRVVATFSLYNQTILKMVLMLNDNNSFIVTNWHLFMNYIKKMAQQELENLNFFLL